MAGKGGSLTQWRLSADWLDCEATVQLPPASIGGVAFPDVMCLSVLEEGTTIVAACSSAGYIALWDLTRCARLPALMLTAEGTDAKQLQ